MDELPQTNPTKPISDESFQALISSLENIFNPTDLFKLRLRSVLFEISYKKGSNILNAGAKQSIIWFILDGLLQEITVDKHTFSTKTTWFWFKHNFVYAMPGFFDQEPSQITINVVKDCKVVFISYENWKVLKDSAWKSISRFLFAINNVAYLILIILFSYWGLYNVFN